MRNALANVMDATAARPRPIDPTTHGVLDYSTVALTAAAPALLDMPDEAATAAYALAAGYLGLSLLTNYKLSARRAVPFRVHGAIEGAIGLALPVLPWALGFAGHRKARNFFFGLSALTAVVATLTDWREDG